MRKPLVLVIYLILSAAQPTPAANLIVRGIPREFTIPQTDMDNEPFHVLLPALGH